MAERRAPDGRNSRLLPRWSLALQSAVHGLVFGWAAVALPWRSWTLVAVLTAGHAALHGLVAALAASGHGRLGPVWRAQSFFSLGYLLYLGWGLLSAAWTIQSIYVGLGQGLAAALAAILGLLALATVPLACWGILATGGIRLTHWGGAGLLLVAIGASGLWWRGHQARGETIVDPTTAAEVEALLGDTAAAGARDPPPSAPLPSLMTTAPTTCAQPPTEQVLSLVATFLTTQAAEGRAVVTSRCFQAPSATSLTDALSRELAGAAIRGPVKLDLITRRAELPSPADSLLASLALRPGLDGLCAGTRCLMPWQLVAMDSFTQHQPLAMVPDARLGASVEPLGEALTPPVGASLQAISTRSWLITAEGQLVAFSRGLPRAVPLTAASLTAATRLAERYVRSAQRANGRFRYLVHPFTGHQVDEPFSVARQAGTTMVACELGGPGPELGKAVRRSLGALAKLEQRFAGPSSLGELGVMASLADRQHLSVKIGPSALTLAALLRCRQLAGPRHDDWIGRLTRLLLNQQRADGTFHHRVSTTTGEPTPEVGSLYVDGQVVLALVLLEGLAAAESPSFPSRSAVRAAVSRAMDAFGHRYWPAFLRPLLYAEENWHCLAAAAAVDHHRHDGYEQLCLDYVTFKTRFIHDEQGGAHRDYWGGYGLGPIVPPHNTATAGLGEALAAAIQIRRARGMDSTAEVATLRQVVGFLLRNQWHPDRCFACARGVPIAGGFSEHLASPAIRIDYVQHAWAALGHGARALGMARAPAH
ncbi:MAG: hypothetical protein JRI68_08015 [Deltaproteobacteria bacterium]|nr:hypothetical protein [Deltaproteobacteria bacterium]